MARDEHNKAAEHHENAAKETSLRRALDYRCPASYMQRMAQTFRARLLEVTVTAQRPTLWKWEISEQGMEIMSGCETSRETAQTQGDSALFMLLSESLS